MLSILIPIYNYDVRSFVRALHKQCTDAAIDFEIVCFDDNSKPEFIQLNREISQLPYISLKELSKNVGRSKIRNWLAREAKYEYLMFLDCDSKPSSPNFIKTYLKYLHPNQLTYGGRSYEMQKPTDSNKVLRWKYGVNRECILANDRAKSPYQSFMTNNFVIPKGIFTAIKFDETIHGYGHEDTLFGIALKKWRIPIEHIDNPLIHLGLEDTKDFLTKTKEGINNLHKLNLRQLLDQDVKLLRYYSKLKRFKLKTLFIMSFKIIEPALLKNLHSDNPNLKKFDLWKLGKLLELD